MGSEKEGEALAVAQAPGMALALGSGSGREVRNFVLLCLGVTIMYYHVGVQLLCSNQQSLLCVGAEALWLEK